VKQNVGDGISTRGLCFGLGRKVDTFQLDQRKHGTRQEKADTILAAMHISKLSCWVGQRLEQNLCQISIPSSMIIQIQATKVV
jgi:hypothetical protein